VIAEANKLHTPNPSRRGERADGNYKFFMRNAESSPLERGRGCVCIFYEIAPPVFYKTETN